MFELTTLTSPFERVGDLLASFGRLAVLVSAAWSMTAFAQPTCSVASETKLDTITGRFSFGRSTLALTLPYTLYRSDPEVVYMQVSGGDFPKELLLDSNGEKVRIQDGAEFHLFPKGTNPLTFSKRLIFSITDTGGKSLCEWVTNVRTSKFDPPFIPEGFGPLSDLSHQVRHPRFTTKVQGFRNAGDPILLEVGGKLASGTGEFSIDGLPATVLARTAYQVILEDSHPAAGMRVNESRGYSISIAVVVLEMKLLSSPSPGPTSIEINLLGRDRIALPALWDRSLALTNFDPSRLQILCDKPPHGLGPSFIRLHGNEDRLTASCRVNLLKPGPVSIDARLLETKTVGGWPRLN
ncbi:MAG TPA: hypothetical protein VME43_29135 [Bryobacteraceae bacterium]|nr:hypothetical protein [Bryobacteraceae bacterium]